MSPTHTAKSTDSQSHDATGQQSAGAQRSLAGRAVGLRSRLRCLLSPAAPLSRLEWAGHGPRVDPEHPRPVTEGRRTFTHVGVVPASAERTFPLLCPVLEYLWLDDWRAEMLYTASGVAEEGAVFRTWLHTGELWVTTCYEPPSHVAYTVFAGPAVMVLDLQLSERDDGSTELRWQRTYTSTGALGRHVIKRLADSAVETELAVIHERLRHYLASGQPLSLAEAKERVRGEVPGPR